MTTASRNGIITGVLIAALLLGVCCFTFNMGAGPCVPGTGFLLLPIVLIGSLIVSAILLKSTSPLILAMAKTILGIMLATVAFLGLHIIFF